MNVECICIHLLKNIRQNNLTGVIHSVFDNALNILTSNSQFITVLSSSKPMSPNAIKLQDDVSFLKLGIKSGMKVSFTDRYAYLEKLNIFLNYGKAKKWSGIPAFPAFKDSEENVNRKMKIIKDFLMKKGSAEGIIPLLSTLKERVNDFELTLSDNRPLNSGEQFVKERFLDFIEAYIKEQKEQIGDKIIKIIGFGAGLTPSVDDFICGLMISRVYLFNYFNKDFNEAIDFNEQMIKKVDGKTTRVSEEMLKLCAKGEVNENIRSLMLSLTSNTSQDKFEINLDLVASFGETSGTDIICGVYIGSKILFNQYIRR